VLAKLPPKLREVAELLQRTDSISEAACVRGVARSSFMRDVEKLRQAFVDAGLRIYLNTSRQSEDESQNPSDESPESPPEDPT
jgi:hypothetical protein